MIVHDVSKFNYEGLSGEFRDRIHYALNTAIQDYKLNVKEMEQVCVIFTALSAVIIDYGSRAGMTFDALRDGVLICIDAARMMAARDAGMVEPKKEST